MTDFNEYYEARSLITDVLERDLVGPVADDEILAESPLSYYITNRYPKKRRRQRDITRSSFPTLPLLVQPSIFSAHLKNMLSPGARAKARSAFVLARTQYLIFVQNLSEEPTSCW